MPRLTTLGETLSIIGLTPVDQVVDADAIRLQVQGRVSSGSPGLRAGYHGKSQLQKLKSSAGGGTAANNVNLDHENVLWSGQPLAFVVWNTQVRMMLLMRVRDREKGRVASW